MHPELSDLLREAAQDAPPPRYDVEDAVRAGKRRQRRRRAGAALAAVLAVAVAIGVPQITGRSSRPAPQPARPTPAPTATAVRALGLTHLIGAFSVGDIRVGDPDNWTFTGEGALIDKRGTEAGQLFVYQPGIDVRSVIKGSKATEKAKITETAAIRGRSAYRVDLLPVGLGLIWEYADGAMAEALTYAGASGRLPLSEAELRQVAEAFRPTSLRPVTLPFALSHVPAGYRITEVGGPGGAGLGSVRLVPASIANEWLKQSVPDTSLDTGVIRISLRRTVPASHGSPRKGTICRDGSTDTGTKHASCFVFLPGGKYVLEGNTTSAGKTELTKMLQSARFGKLDDPAAWIPVSTGFPASAQVGRG